MLEISRIQPTRTASKLTLALLLSLSAAAMTGCASPDRQVTGSLPDDYRTRHPISITEAERSLDIPVASGDARMTQGMRDVVRGFASDYRNSGSGTVQIILPQGSPNAHAAYRVRKEIRAVLASEGIPQQRMIETSYQASPDEGSAAIRLSYIAIKAQTAPCGAWPEDLVKDTSANNNYENFGCATQSNLAAQIANPMDLVAPRAMSPVDATQRGQVIKDYQGVDSGSTTTSITIN